MVLDLQLNDGFLDIGLERVHTNVLIMFLKSYRYNNTYNT